MALVFMYEVTRMDGSGFKVFKNKSQAEAYARSLKTFEGEKIRVTRRGNSSYAPYTYYV